MPTVIAVAGWIILGIVVILLLLSGAGYLLRRQHQGQERRARASFAGQRPRLEGEFFRLAAASGKPKGLRWLRCEWEGWVEFARQRQMGELVALVGLTIYFEAIEGGDMEGVAAVSLPRNATAVFFYRAGQWHTVGKAIFNKNPDEAAALFGDRYERLPNEPK